MGRARVAPLASEGGDGARPQVVAGGGRTQGRVGGGLWVDRRRF